MRVLDDTPVEGWVLLDIEAQGFRRSIAHGQVRVWHPDGRLAGVASQTCIVRTSHHGRLAPGAPEPPGQGAPR